VIVCSAGRYEPLAATLRSLAEVQLPGEAELILVDNNPQPQYQDLPFSAWEKRYVHESKRGLSCARNRGLKEARGEIIAFTDDDLRFEPDFLVELVKPIQDGLGDAAAGTIKIAPELEESWMEPWHRIAFASTEHLDMQDPKGFVGANFAFHSRVLESVPGFDEELGAGKLGTGEETLFAQQLLDKGFRIVGAPKSVVWHHFDPSRKTRESLHRASEAWGRSNAYIDFHYRGLRLGALGLRRMKSLIALQMNRLKGKRGASPMGVQESTLIKNIAYYKAMVALQKGK
jgi:glucosyl-dolichyl phosphate glucuronosyltransferase